MLRSGRHLIIGLLALFMPLVSSSASATAALTIQPVSPSGAYTLATSGDSTLTFTSVGFTLNCTASSIRATLNSGGDGIAPVGAYAQACSSPLLGLVRATQLSDWTVSAVAELGTAPNVLIGFDVTVPARGLQIVSPGPCTFTASGSLTVGAQFSLPITRTLATFNTFAALAAPKQSLVVDSFAGGACTLIGLRVGLAIAHTGTYRLNRAMTVG